MPEEVKYGPSNPLKDVHPSSSFSMVLTLTVGGGGVTECDGQGRRQHRLRKKRRVWKPNGGRRRGVREVGGMEREGGGVSLSLTVIVATEKFLPVVHHGTLHPAQLTLLPLLPSHSREAQVAENSLGDLVSSGRGYQTSQCGEEGVAAGLKNGREKQKPAL